MSRLSLFLWYSLLTWIWQANGFGKPNPEGGIIINLYEQIKSAVTPRQAAEAYGMTVTRSGMTRCPFHTDGSPSMKLYDAAYHCFGCQAHGDVIALTAGLHGTGMREAAKRLAADFGIPVTEEYTAADRMERRHRETVLERERRETEYENRCFLALADYLHILRDWREQYRPNGDEPPHPRFAEACRMYTAVEYMVDTLTTGGKTARRALTAELRSVDGLRRLEEYLAEISDSANRGRKGNGIL